MKPEGSVDDQSMAAHSLTALVDLQQIDPSRTIKTEGTTAPAIGLEDDLRMQPTLSIQYPKVIFCTAEAI